MIYPEAGRRIKEALVGFFINKVEFEDFTVSVLDHDQFSLEFPGDAMAMYLRENNEIAIDGYAPGIGILSETVVHEFFHHATKEEYSKEKAVTPYELRPSEIAAKEFAEKYLDEFGWYYYKRFGDPLWIAPTDKPELYYRTEKELRGSLEGVVEALILFKKEMDKVAKYGATGDILERMKIFARSVVTSLEKDEYIQCFVKEKERLKLIHEMQTCLYMLERNRFREVEKRINSVRERVDEIYKRLLMKEETTMSEGEKINYSELVEAKGLYEDDKLIGMIGLYADDAVAVCFKGKCYVTAKNQKKIYYIAQSWYSDLFPNLQIREIK